MTQEQGFKGVVGPRNAGVAEVVRYLGEVKKTVVMGPKNAGVGEVQRYLSEVAQRAGALGR